MAQNPIPDPFDPLVAHAEDSADGANQHGASIGLLQNTEAAIRADITALTSAENTFQTYLMAKSMAMDELQTANSNGKAFIALFLRTGKTTIGTKWNAVWNAAGFAAGSLSVPRSQDERFGLLGSIRDFLSSHPQYESTNATHPELDVTAAIATSRYSTISTVRFNVNQAETNSGTAKDARDLARNALHARLTGLREELGQLLDDDDSRWYAFGFNRPADPETPGVPDGLVVTQGVAGSGTLIVDWNDSRRSTGFKVYARINGAQHPLEFGFFEDSQAVITLTPGAVVQITVAAHNNHGYSAPSAPVNATAP